LQNGVMQTCCSIKAVPGADLVTVLVDEDLHLEARTIDGLHLRAAHVQRPPPGVHAAQTAGALGSTLVSSMRQRESRLVVKTTQLVACSSTRATSAICAKRRVRRRRVTLQARQCEKSGGWFCTGKAVREEWRLVLYRQGSARRVAVGVVKSVREEWRLVL
jgi:hypothetical protein